MCLEYFLRETLIDFPAPDRLALKFIMFDMVLFAPTRFAYKYLKSHITKGGSIYFDEAFDSDERLLIRYFMMKVLKVLGVALTKLWESSDLSAKFGASGKVQCEREFGIAKMNQAHKELYIHC